MRRVRRRASAATAAAASERENFFLLPLALFAHSPHSSVSLHSFFSGSRAAGQRHEFYLTNTHPSSRSPSSQDCLRECQEQIESLIECHVSRSEGASQQQPPPLPPHARDADVFVDAPTAADSKFASVDAVRSGQPVTPTDVQDVDLETSKLVPATVFPDATLLFP